MVCGLNVNASSITEEIAPSNTLFDDLLNFDAISDVSLTNIELDFDDSLFEDILPQINQIKQNFVVSESVPPPLYPQLILSLIIYLLSGHS